MTTPETYTREGENLSLPEPDRFEVVFVHGDPDTEGTVQGGVWDMDLRKMLNNEAFNAIRTKMPNIADVYERQVESARQRLKRVGDSAAGFTNLGKALAATGNLDSAIEVYSKALQIDQGFVPAKLGRAESLLHAGHLEAALEDAAELVDHKMIGYLASNIMADASYRLGQLDRSLSILGKALRRWPDKGKTHLNQGIVLVKLNQTQMAAASFRKALRHEPTLGDAYYGLALCHLQLKQPNKALRQFRIGLALGSVSPPAIRNLAKVCQDLSRDSDVVDILSKHLESYAHDWTSRLMLANSYHRLRKFKQARTELEFIRDWAERNGVEKLPADCSYEDVLNNVGATYSATAEYDEALGFYHKATEAAVTPKETAMGNIARVHQQLRQVEKADHALEEMARFHGDSDFLKFLTARQHFIKGTHEISFNALTTLVQARTKVAGAYELLASLQSDWKSTQSEALGTLKRGLEVLPRNSGLRVSLAHQYIEMKALNAAKKVMDAEDWPADMPAAVATWGRYFLQIGEFHKGNTQFNMAIKLSLDPEAREVMEHEKRFEMGLYHLRVGEVRKARNQFKQVLKLPEQTFVKVKARRIIDEIDGMKG